MKRLVTNTTASAADFAILATLNVVATPLLLDALGTAGYGVFVFLSIFSIFAALAVLDLGMEGSVMTEVARAEGEGRVGDVQRITAAAIVVYACLGIVVGGVLLFLGNLIVSHIDLPAALNAGDSLIRAIHLVALNVTLQFLCLPFMAVTKGLGRFVIAKGINATGNVIQYAVVLISALIWHRVDIAFAVIAVTTFLRLVGYVTAFRVRFADYWPLSWRLDRTTLKILLSYSSLLFVSRIIGLIFRYLDKVLIYLLLPITRLAAFEVVLRPALLVRAVISVLVSALIPEAARLKAAGERGELRLIYLRLIRIAFLLTMPVVVGLAVHHQAIIIAWVGDRFIDDTWLLVPLVIAAALNPFGAVGSTMAVGLHLVRQTIWISIAGTVVNLAVSLALVQAYGLAGLIVGTLVAELVMVVPYTRFFQRYLSISGRELTLLVGRVVVAGVVGVGLHLGPLYLLQDWLLLAGGVTAASLHLAICYYLLIAPADRYLVSKKVRHVIAPMRTPEAAA